MWNFFLEVLPVIKNQRSPFSHEIPRLGYPLSIAHADDELVNLFLFVSQCRPVTLTGDAMFIVV